MAVIVGIRKWVVIATVFVGLCVGIGTMIARWKPAPPEPCQDEALLDSPVAHMLCDSRAVLSAEAVGGYMLFKCTCRRDGGQ